MRHIALANTFNLRDLGGYSAADGRTVRWRTLYRGAGLHRLAGDDLGRVRGLGLRLAIDLRTPGELEDRGGWPAELAPTPSRHLPVIDAVWDHSGLGPDAPAVPYLLDRYREMFDPGRPAVAEALRLLAEPGHHPAVFYCAAGKDRTGVVAALVLALLGVSDEDIAADYALSGAQVARMLDRARGLARGTPMVDQPSQLMQAPAEAMLELLAWVRAEHGSAEALAERLGAGAGTVAALRRHLLEVPTGA